MKKFFTTSYENHSLLSKLIISSGLIGFVVGIFILPEWMDSVENAQLMAGLVVYPVSTPQYIFQKNLWSLVNQMCSLFLLMGVGEITLSYIISGLLSSVAFMAFSCTIWCFNKKFILALLLPFFILYTNIINFGVNYDIEFVNVTTVGKLAQNYSLLVVALFGCSRYRYAFFLVGIMPAVHPFLAIPLWFALLICALTNFEKSKSIIKSHFPSLLIGLFISLASFGYYYFFKYDLPHIELSPELIKKYLHAAIYSWGIHRKPVDLMSPGLFINFIVLVLATIYIKYFKTLYQEETRLIFKTSIIYTLVGTVGAILTNLPPQYVPDILLILMPARILNFNVLICICYFFGLLGLAKNSRSIQLLVGFLLLVLVGVPIIFNQNIPQIYSFYSVLITFLLVLFLITLRGTRLLNVMTKTPKFCNSLYLSVILILLFCPFIVIRNGINNWQYKNNFYFRDKTNDLFYSEVSKGKGILLTSSNCCRLIQLKTRRPMLYNGDTFDDLVYMPQLGPTIKDLFQEIHGIDFFNRPKKWGHLYHLHPSAGKKLWEARSKTDWILLAKKYHFSQIVTYHDWNLQLPMTAKNNQYRLYSLK